MDDETAVLADDGTRPVLFCHGGPGLWDTLQAPAALLTGRRVYHWDQRGCGRSQRRGPYSVDRSVADLDAVRRHFGLDRVALLGHSWGARLALGHALAHPGSVSRLVLVSGTGIDDDATWHPRYQDAFFRALGEDRARWEELRARDTDRTQAEDRELAVLQWSVDFADRDRAREHAEAMATPWFGVNAECNATIGAELRQGSAGLLRERCAALEVPVLIVDGERDIRPRRAVDSLERVLPRVRRTTLAGAGHLPWTEDPEGFRSAVGAFLA